MNFGQAIGALKAGKAVGREGWNGKGMFIFLKKGSHDAAIVQAHINGVVSELFEKGDEGTVVRMPCICMKAADGSTVEGWLASQTDMLADDWQDAERSA
ncbi:DUF2829 domain-containing protein [Paramixta manurensis]|uniref:DUF2829 domain-containing protein n=1 Tax=Paramixta manurensis TaxID=2740817 RepID=A0A6M8U9L2_9GAMM|nr:DUF2829 domain-containing protein [Erwiniaceae bacterium PD-1]